jgi:hypothetical protein
MQKSNFTKIHPVLAEFHADTHKHTDGQTHMTKPIVGFSQFASEPKSEGRKLFGNSQCIKQLERPERRWQNNLFLKMDIYMRSIHGWVGGLIDG